MPQSICFTSTEPSKNSLNASLILAHQNSKSPPSRTRMCGFYFRQMLASRLLQTTHPPPPLKPGCEVQLEHYVLIATRYVSDRCERIQILHSDGWFKWVQTFLCLPRPRAAPVMLCALRQFNRFKGKKKLRHVELRRKNPSDSTDVRWFTAENLGSAGV